MSARVLYWFRTDLRLHDSPALHAALRLNPDVFYPTFTWDPEYVFAHRVGVNRMNFLLESMHDLSSSLSACNPKNKLHVVRGPPQSVIPALCSAWRITHLVFEKDSASYAATRDADVKARVLATGVQVLDILGHTLYDPKAVVEAHGGKATLSISSWRSAVSHLPAPDRPLPSPTHVPPPGCTDLTPFTRTEHPVHRDIDLNAGGRETEVTCYDSFVGSKGGFEIPTLEELGLPLATTSIRGGESEALRRLAAFCEDAARVVSFSKPKTSPTAFDPPATTLLSPYMKFGCLGPREFLWRDRDCRTEWKTGGGRKKSVRITGPPENLEGQLQFREMYYAAECAQGLSFGHIRGNAICRFIDWRLQDAYDASGQKIVPRPLGNAVDEERLTAWREGRTGFPWIDAIMRQLRIEGWIHHLARHAVACYLTRGQCYVSWERGAEVFDEWLIDWDPCSNPGNWMWLSCSAFYSQYYRIYGVVSFPKKFDESGMFVRKYCPELERFPDKFIYTPHLAPLSVQQDAGCIIGQDYPFPMLDEKVEKERCIQRMKAAYSLGLYGNHPSVLDGSAGAMFHPEANSGDRLSGGQKKLGKRRRDEQGDGRSGRGKKRLA